MPDEIDIVEIEHQDAAVVHLRIPRSRINDEIEPAIQEVLAVLGEHGVSPAGPLFAHHLSISDSEFDIEVGFPVSGHFAEAGRVRCARTPGGKAARRVYIGPYEGLYDAWRQFGNDCARRALKPAGNRVWEVYASGPEGSPDSSQWRTELYRPVL